MQSSLRQGGSCRRGREVCAPKRKVCRAILASHVELRLHQQLFFLLELFTCDCWDIMAYKADFKTTFEPSRVIQPIYTGGSVSLSKNGRILATCLGEDALLTDLETGAHLGRIEGVSVAVPAACNGLTVDKDIGR